VRPRFLSVGVAESLIFLAEELFSDLDWLLGLERELKPRLDYERLDPNDQYERKIEVVRAAERYADLILSDPAYAQLQSRPYMCADAPLDLSQYSFHVHDKKVPLILHAPTNRAFKGTDYVLASIERLKREGLSFRFRLVERVPHTKLTEMLADPDIAIDQLCRGWVVVLDRTSRYELACGRRAHIVGHHDHVKVTQSIIDRLKAGKVRESDLVPTFYRRFVMPEDLLRKERLRRRNRGLRRIRYWWLWPLIMY